MTLEFEFDTGLVTSPGHVGFPGSDSCIIVLPKIMSIISANATVPEACFAWLAANPHLSTASRMSYQGEIDRLGQYVAAKFGLLTVGELTAGHWEKYLQAMRRSRKPVHTRRSDVLKTSSVLQAMRISRQFLIWCAEQGLLKWWPPRPNLSVLATRVVGSRAPSEIPKILRLALSGALETAASPQEARALLAINLAYWGALDVGELAALKLAQLHWRAASIRLLLDGGRQLHLPVHLRASWLCYRSLREGELGARLAPSAPILASLDAQSPLRPWSVWAMVKSWQEERGIDAPFSPRMLRAAFLRSTQASEAAGFAASIAHAGMLVARVPAATGDITAQIRRIQHHEMQRLAV